MHIVVCLKQVEDPEIPAEHFEIDPDTNRPDEDSSDMVMDVYAEHALETAIQLRDELEDAKVTVISIDDEESEEVLRKAYAFTTDEVIRVWDSDWDETTLDGQVVGHVLAKVIADLDADLILTGYQASDIEEGIVGPIIAEELQIPGLTLVSDVNVKNGNLHVISDAGNRLIEMEVTTPAVLTIVSSEKNIPRLPKVKEVRLARRKQIQEIELDDIEGLDEERSQPSLELIKTFIPERDTNCNIISGDNEAQQVERLMDELHHQNVL